MSAEGWIRRAALLAIPLIALGLYFTRRAPLDTGAAPADAPTPDPASSSGVLGAFERSRLGTASEGSRLAEALAERGEAALGKPRAKHTDDVPATSPTPSPTPTRHAAPLPVATSAAELPLAGSVSRRAPRTSAARRSTGPASPCGGVEVKLITASDDPAWAFASLAPAPGERASIRHVGDRIGSWQVDTIEWDRVWLRGGAGRCAVGMHFGAREAEEGLPAGKRMRLSADAPVDKPWRVPGEIANAIDKLGETEFAVERAMVPAIFDRAGDLLSGLQIDPVKQGDAVVGLEIGEVLTDSILERLGVETGDVVLALDGKPVENLEGLVRVLGEARENERLVARLRRNGEAFDLRVVTR